MFRACATALDLRTEALYAGLVPFRVVPNVAPEDVYAAESDSSRKNEERSFALLTMTADDREGDSQSGERDRSPNASQFEVVNLRPRVGMELLRERPDCLNSLAQHPLLVLGIEEFHFVAHDRQGFVITGPCFEDRPIGGPHQALRAVGIV